MGFKKVSMTVQILVAMVIGITLGLLFPNAASNFKIVGDIFLRLIQMSVVLLIAGTVTEAVGSLDTKIIGKLGAKIFFWFMTSTVIAATLGILISKIVKPGVGIPLQASTEISINASQTFSEILLNFFPTNIVGALANSNTIQVIVFAVLFGFSISAMRESDGKNKVLEFIQEFNQILLKLITLVMQVAPIGIGALIFYTTGSIGIKVIIPLIKFLLALGIGSVIHLGICIFVASAYCRTNPFLVAKKLTRMTVMAFTITSSAICLPVKMQDSEEKLGVSKNISGLVNPLGMTLNSNGLAIYLTVACLTLTQAYGIELSTMLLIKVVALSTLSCLGTVVVPGGGLVALAIVIPALGLPIEGIALLAGIDWFSGMFRTVLNVDIDALVSMVIAKDSKELDYEVLNSEKVA